MISSRQLIFHRTDFDGATWHISIQYPYIDPLFKSRRPAQHWNPSVGMLSCLRQQQQCPRIDMYFSPVCQWRSSYYRTSKNRTASVYFCLFWAIAKFLVLCKTKPFGGDLVLPKPAFFTGHVQVRYYSRSKFIAIWRRIAHLGFLHQSVHVIAAYVNDRPVIMVVPRPYAPEKLLVKCTLTSLSLNSQRNEPFTNGKSSWHTLSASGSLMEAFGITNHPSHCNDFFRDMIQGQNILDEAWLPSYPFMWKIKVSKTFWNFRFVCLWFGIIWNAL